MGPDVKGNPLYISVYLLIASYIIGEFIFPKYPLFYILNLFGLLIIILMVIVFFSSRNAFNVHEEKLLPQTETNKIIKTILKDIRVSNYLIKLGHSKPISDYFIVS